MLVCRYCNSGQVYSLKDGTEVCRACGARYPGVNKLCDSCALTCKQVYKHPNCPVHRPIGSV